MAQSEPTEEDYDAHDYRAFFDSDILRVWHLEGREKTFKIARVTRFTGETVDQQTKKRKVQRQPSLRLETRTGKPLALPLLLNKTNAKTIAQLYGKRPSQWVGRWITLYPTTTEAFGKTEDCIRIRNYDPVTHRRPTQQRSRQQPGRSAREPVLPLMGAVPAEAEEDLPPSEPRSEENEFTDHDLDVTDDPEEPPPGALETDHE